MKPCFGIDLGTTTSAIGRVVDGHPVLVPIDGQTLLPSVVYVPVQGPLLVGQPAIHQEALHPERVLRSAKRRMGTGHVYEVGGRRLTPVDVSAAILGRLVDAVEQAGDDRPERVVITVPAWFTQAQRADTRAAGEQAGLDVVRIVNEPTAAALAHAHGHPRDRTVLVYDFGGGTFDVSLVRQQGEILEVLASHGDTELGGDDIDAALMHMVCTELDRSDAPFAAAVRASIPARAALRGGIERAKIHLSESATAHLSLPFLATVDHEPRHLERLLEREDLEDLLLPFFLRTTQHVDQVLEHAGLAPTDIDDLLLVGGSTQLPQIWKGLRVRYGLQGDASIAPRLAVALGAAVQAAIVDGSRVDGILVDVAPYPLSIGVMTGGIPGFPTHFAAEVITPRNTPLPARHTHLVRTSHPEQTRIRLPVYQGSDPDPRNNAILGEIVMENIPPAPSDQMFRPIAVEFHHDLDGTVDIVIRDQLSDRTTRGKVVADGASRESLRERWIAHAEKHELVFGDPYLAGTPPSDEPVDPARVREASDLFDAVAASADQVQADAPDEAPGLLALADAGRLALGIGDHARAIEQLEELQDALFEAGVYL